MVGGSAETYWLEARRGLHANIDKDAKPLPPDKQTELKEQIDEYVNNLRRGDPHSGHGAQHAGRRGGQPAGAVRHHHEARIGRIGYSDSHTLLAPSAASSPAREDEGNWAGRIEERQIHFAEPVILRPLIDRLISFGALPEPSDGEYEINWQSLSDPW